LAGSLGLKVFTLLPFAADWRWLENRPGSPHYSRTPWYPTMTLFRQTTCRNWRSVVTRLIKAIRAEAEAKAATLNGLRPKPADLNGRDNVPPGECHRPLIKPSLISDISCGGNGHAPSAAESATRPEAVIGVAELAEGNGSMPGGGHRNGRVSSGPV
jgi:hypothetical protein